MQEFNSWVKLAAWPKILFFFAIAALIIFLFVTTCYFLFEKKYKERVYPGVKIEGIDFGGKRQDDVALYLQQKNAQLSLSFTFQYQNEMATLSAQDLDWGYDAKLMTTQATVFGRSGNFLSDIYQKYSALRHGWETPISYYYDEPKLSGLLSKMAERIDVPPEEGLFRFSEGRVTAFHLPKNGQALDIASTNGVIRSAFSLLKRDQLPSSFIVELPVNPVEPKVSAEEIDKLGVKELISRGTSRFYGSIANRIHNIQLAAGRLNGILVAPDEEFSFNKALGDVSKFTGYKEAYIIKDGRTILGDGGGVCQVSTTLFRALLNAGLPVTERHPHSYRVGYYEQDSLPGLDASVYAPSWDLKFRNDTGHFILIQSSVNPQAATLTFELYGTSDDRTTTISKPVIKNQTPPPDDLYQDDPTLPKGQVKQIDWKAQGADVSFTRKVEMTGKVLIDEIFSSRYNPWQAVFLRGTKE